MEASLICIAVTYVLLVTNKRIDEVYKFRSKIIDMIDQMGGEEWRYEAYRKVTYHEMVLKFWKPLELSAWYKYDILEKTCVCAKPTPTGMWGVRNRQSIAECCCGGWYNTTLLPIKNEKS